MVDVCLVSSTVCVGGSVNRTNQSIAVYWFGTIEYGVPFALRFIERHISSDAAHEASGIDQHIDLPPALDDPGHRRLHLLALAHVGLIPGDSGGQRFSSGAQGLLIAPDDSDLCAPLCKRLRCRPPHAAVAAGNNDLAWLLCHTHVVPLLFFSISHQGMRYAAIVYTTRREQVGAAMSVAVCYERKRETNDGA